MEKSLKGMSRVKNLNISKISMKVCVLVFCSNYAHSLLRPLLSLLISRLLSTISQFFKFLSRELEQPF